MVMMSNNEELTNDHSVDWLGHPASREKTGKWVAANMLLVNQGLATLSFFGVGVNLVLFLTRVMGLDNANAANDVSIWTGTVYVFSLLGAFLSDSSWGRYKTCVIFQAILVIGLISLSLSSQMFLVKPEGCGKDKVPCGAHSKLEFGLFYLSIYLVALGYGGYQPNIVSFGADQFDDQHPQEKPCREAFFSYFYLALNLGSFFSNTILGYFEDKGQWALGFWTSAGFAFIGLVLFIFGTPKYRHYVPINNPYIRFCQVIVSAIKKWRVKNTINVEELYEGDDVKLANTQCKKMMHTHGFKFLDRAAIMTSNKNGILDEKDVENPWSTCTVTQVEEVKCILRLLPIWICTIIYSVVFTQMSSIFVEQGAAMKTKIGNFKIPPASMSGFDIFSVAVFIFFYRFVIDPLVAKSRKSRSLSELERMGIGLIIAMLSMVAAAMVEHFRLRYANNECANCEGSSSLSIFWQVPQYALVGASEVFMYVGQLEFFNKQAPDGLKSFGSALTMTSMSFGNYVSWFLVSIVMKFSRKNGAFGWIPGNLNKGHLDRFYFLLASLTIIDFGLYVICARKYKSDKFAETTQTSVTSTRVKE
ncbi:transporter [Lithospermum erythrorhizon]|uniref:Transporter n=1 Tax=Lithospermum erythrorhizon TaxID=34254 RepID=A0AAV3NTW1_LITER